MKITSVQNAKHFRYYLFLNRALLLGKGRTGFQILQYPGVVLVVRGDYDHRRLRRRRPYHRSFVAFLKTSKLTVIVFQVGLVHLYLY